MDLANLAENAIPQKQTKGFHHMEMFMSLTS